MSELLPDGISKLRDAPYPLHYAIKGALGTGEPAGAAAAGEGGTAAAGGATEGAAADAEDVPPRNIWTDGKVLGEWFDGVRRKHRDKLDGRDIEDPRTNGALDILIHD